VPSPIPKPVAGLRAKLWIGTPKQGEVSLVGGKKLRLLLKKDTTKIPDRNRSSLTVFSCSLQGRKSELFHTNSSFQKTPIFWPTMPTVFEAK
jgi:hypothetical protein